MEQTAETHVKRHNLYYFLSLGRDRIVNENCSDSAQNQELEELWHTFPQIPVICARQEEACPEGMLNAGISFPAREGGVRRRFAVYIPEKEIWGMRTPWELTDFERLPEGKFRDALLFIKERKAESVCLGTFGSAALQIATDLPYLDDSSDIDLIIETGTFEELEGFRRLLMQAAERFGVSFDVEVLLGRDYSVKLAELFSGSGTVLAKGSHEVKLLETRGIRNCRDLRKLEA